eukprot:gnl/TRDRNA2_/TRDRNA2_87182_c1_seq1.p1 gnl/TRDRNA2_/TRDRNA2_87182_c1~~gnl/TRDRNA2_/TRDRNA2_87182_c1_seq1.p1  ORF type:complete len:301 (-),score=54.56 gnl/TRDRNA2_/TRDRNA2_87182_c1_seq1:154-924(-)
MFSTIEDFALVVKGDLAKLMSDVDAKLVPLIGRMDGFESSIVGEMMEERALHIQDIGGMREDMDRRLEEIKNTINDIACPTPPSCCLTPRANGKNEPDVVRVRGDINSNSAHDSIQMSSIKHPAPRTTELPYPADAGEPSNFVHSVYSPQPPSPGSKGSDCYSTSAGDGGCEEQTVIKMSEYFFSRVQAASNTGATPRDVFHDQALHGRSTTPRRSPKASPAPSTTGSRTSNKARPVVAELVPGLTKSIPTAAVLH